MEVPVWYTGLAKTDKYIIIDLNMLMYHLKVWKCYIYTVYDIQCYVSFEQ